LSANPTALPHQFEDRQQQHEAAILGMWLFLATEVMVFAGLFLAYTIYRGWYAEAFAHASNHLDVRLGGINTAVLLCSSLTMALAVRAAYLGGRNALLGYLALTIVLGTAFLSIKCVEYIHDYHEGLIPGLAFDTGRWARFGVLPQEAALFFTLYFVMTGLHAVHMIVGLGVLVVLILLAMRRRFSPEYNSPVENTGLYWHFVDVIWIFLFPLFYLIGTHP
jgi:cytochrome c oxidase subunit 3